MMPGRHSLFWRLVVLGPPYAPRLALWLPLGGGVAGLLLTLV